MKTITVATEVEHLFEAIYVNGELLHQEESIYPGDICDAAGEFPVKLRACQVTLPDSEGFPKLESELIELDD